MAYWLVAGSNSGASKQMQYFMDSDSDLSSLPNMEHSGTNSDDVAALPCGKGSSALSIGSGKIYILNSNNQWVEFDS